MKGVAFPQANGKLVAPKGMESQVYDLPVGISKAGDTGQTVIISCWELDDADIKELTVTRRMYMVVLGHGMPPIELRATNPFVEIDKPREPHVDHTDPKPTPLSAMAE